MTADTEGTIIGKDPEKTDDDLDLGKPWDFLAVDWARNQIVKIFRRLAQVEVYNSEAARVIDELSEELAGVQRKLQDDNARITKLEDRAAKTKAELFANLYGMSPTDRGVPDASLDGLNFGVMGDPGAMTVLPEHVSVLSDAGTLDEAERRVRDYMTGSFSEATIGGVVEALRGPETYDGRLPLGHLFRFEAPDRRRCSYRLNHRGGPCGKLASEH